MDQADAALATILETVNATKDVLVARSTPASLQSQLPSCRVQSAVNNSIQSRPVADTVIVILRPLEIPSKITSASQLSRVITGPAQLKLLLPQ